jgi:hypothetical protein
MADLAVLSVGPAPIGQEPPVVLVIVARVALAQIDPSLIVVGHTGECEQAERAERQGQDQGVARPCIGMGQRPTESPRRLPLDGEGEDIDVAALPLRPPPGDKFAGGCDPGLRLHRFSADGVQPGARRVGESEIGVGQDGLVQGLGGSLPA